MVRSSLGEFQSGVHNFAKQNIAEALQRFQTAEYLGHAPDICAAYRWHCWMLLGDFEQAWRESDGIARRGATDPNRLWDELPFAGKRVVIRCIHGYGDAIQFLRYAQLVKKTASRVIVETHPEMVSLLERLPWVDRVTTWSGGPSLGRSDWDQQIEVMELPRAFRTTLNSVPAPVPYLNIEAGTRFRNSCRPRVGLVWASSTWNPARSLAVRELLPILNMDHLSFFSFQRGPERAQLAGLPGNCTVYDTAANSDPAADSILATATDLLQMDLVLTVDTMAAHLAGALGLPVWTLLPWAADWRWMLHREDSPWYPTMRLFRQPEPGDWGTPVRRIAAELRNGFQFRK